MIDQETARQGLEALATAIASIIEDVHEQAVTPAGNRESYAVLAAELGSAGSDIALLAAAMKIFATRAEAVE
ncbi:MAG TPA: hypothetical protein VHW60_16070 [Caulobacteraceae bacterium]|jgi:hypothetical protein|nr:hypothetical protein [Caulobacteraceae bacterium]